MAPAQVTYYSTMHCLQKGGLFLLGIFDSGLGGLTALRELRRLLPEEDFIYFGDTGRVPYGTRSHEAIIKYALQDMRFLMSHNVNAVLVACGTVSSTALDALRSQFSIPIIGVVDAAVYAAAAATKNGVVGVIGTGATISAGAFARSMAAAAPSVKLISTACPLFVPLVENGFIDRDNEVTKLVAESYLSDIRKGGADTLILGCTHFPIISPIIESVLPNVTLINSGAEAAAELAKIAWNSGLLSHGTGHTEFYVSDEPQGFSHVAAVFLGKDISSETQKIDIDKY